MKEILIRHNAAGQLLDLAQELRNDIKDSVDDDQKADLQERSEALIKAYVQVLYNQISKIEGL